MHSMQYLFLTLNCAKILPDSAASAALDRGQLGVERLRLGRGRSRGRGGRRLDRLGRIQLLSPETTKFSHFDNRIRIKSQSSC